jgi:glycosyltransferase involved in cell wall biosynthesis
MAGKRVVWLYRYIPQYRLPFFLCLHEACAQEGIDLKVIYGDPIREDAARRDESNFTPGVFVRNRFIRLGRHTLIWQPVLSHLNRADLVIVEQQSKLLLNYVLLAFQLFGLQRVAFFGHGRTLWASSLGEKIKKRMVRLPYWWFAYTEEVSRYVTQLGFPEERVTVFNNAIDTTELEQWRSEITSEEIDGARRRLNLPSNNVCVYVGSMNSEKRMPFLLEACDRIRTHIPDFSMLFIGAGTDDYLVKQFCDLRPWAVYLGPVFGREKVKYCMLGCLLLIPGAIGLVVLDAFAIQIPIVTTEIPSHGPEIAYLTNDYNSAIVPQADADDVDAYASTAINLLTDPVRLGKLVENCEQSAAAFSIKNMADLFLHGIRRALASDVRPAIQ